MAAESHYMPQKKVDWTSNDAFSQFKLWIKETERIIGGPLASRSDRVMLNHIYIWAGAHAESLIEARLHEDPEVRITIQTALLHQVAACLTHSTFFREKRDEFYSVRQKDDENTTTYNCRILDLYRQAAFPDNTSFLIVDKLIHGCVSKESKRKLMGKGKDMSIKDCLKLMRRCEAVETTMKKLGDSSRPMSMPHMHKIQPKNHKGMGPRKSSIRLSQNRIARGQEERNPVSGARKMLIPATSAEPRMRHVTCTASKDTLN